MEQGPVACHKPAHDGKIGDGYHTISSPGMSCEVGMSSPVIISWRAHTISLSKLNSGFHAVYIPKTLSQS